MDYYIFIDESGDHGLKNIDPNFPNFALCGVIMSQTQYDSLKDSFNLIKDHFWKDKKVIFHSRDIRKCEKEFKILLNINIKADFYLQLADLAAYPIARYVNDKERANPAFDIIKLKIYSKGTKLYGLKEFP